MLLSPKFLDSHGWAIGQGAAYIELQAPNIQSRENLQRHANAKAGSEHKLHLNRGNITHNN